MGQEVVSVAAGELQSLATRIFAAAGCEAEEAARIAAYLVAANLAGHDSHGVIRVPRYLALLRDGLVVANQKVDVLVDTPVLAVVDGKFGFGQTVAPEAVRIGIEKCKAMGLSAVTLRNAGHIGRVADWAEMAAQEGLVSVHFVNAAGIPIVAPFGSAERRFSTAPYAVGVPVPGRAPLLLDFATSVVAEGKVFVASQGGRPVPPDALIAPDGRTSGDPRVLYGDDYESTGRRDARNGLGAIRAFGQHKGSGLALMCELLGGGLSGTGCVGKSGRFANGMFSFYLDPSRMDPEDLFPAEVVRYLDYLKSAKAVPPESEVLLPGDPERKVRAERLASGVPLPAETWRLLMDAARSVGLAMPDQPN